jgi:hypothetical protein
MENMLTSDLDGVGEERAKDHRERTGARVKQVVGDAAKKALVVVGAATSAVLTGAVAWAAATFSL